MRMWWLAAALLLGSWSTPALAQVRIGGGFTITGGGTATSDYRFRGLSQSDGDPALQADAVIDHESGFYAGAFFSTLTDSLRPGEIELSGYVGYTTEIMTATDLDVGVQLYGYPNNQSLTYASYVEPYASLRHVLGPVTAEVGAAYAPEQEALAGNDSLYVYGDLSGGIIILPVTVTARVGYTSGPARFSPYADFLDWRIGAEYKRGPATFRLEYVDTDLPEDAPNGDAALVASLRLGF